ncbi:hypothetical protein [Candidatus Neptunochlamydia vexilliferae]|uniref:Uncharacterized protein n=1 Tax=Candidatus Neptunichlamydia vexilliferae TaxID=1651774 RepID=A0ABS0AWQ1_9BACT|nr:hypothetical protein [Candidatus Neptunochlamydia vexilliferae]MBF5058553.1 hypothetical protein [Candidatus Neptunochlamydia vexilliferae]
MNQDILILRVDRALATATTQALFKRTKYKDLKAVQAPLKEVALTTLKRAVGEAALLHLFRYGAIQWMHWVSDETLKSIIQFPQKILNGLPKEDLKELPNMVLRKFQEPLPEEDRNTLIERLPEQEQKMLNDSLTSQKK